MIQDISPHIYHVEFQNHKPEAEDYVFLFSGSELGLKQTEPIEAFRVKELAQQPAELYYLFSVDDKKYFCGDFDRLPEEAAKISRQQLRRLAPKYSAFAAVTAFHLHGWYEKNRFCGVCQSRLRKDDKERMLRCPECGNMVYPRINPAVIVAVTSKDKLLLTKYKGREYTNYALVAGFCEVGESLEDTVRREVMEEAGLKVKNIRYYGSQPWGFADNLLAGFFCEVDGSEEISMDEEELSLACWLQREEIPVEYTDSSLTNEMICAFKNRQND